MIIPATMQLAWISPIDRFVDSIALTHVSPVHSALCSARFSVPCRVSLDTTRDLVVALGNTGGLKLRRDESRRGTLKRTLLSHSATTAKRRRRRRSRRSELGIQNL